MHTLNNDCAEKNHFMVEMKITVQVSYEWNIRIQVFIDYMGETAMFHTYVS